MSSVSCAVRTRRSSDMYCSVRMLWSRSASLTRMTRMSSTIASSILRKFSACRSSLLENGMALIFVTPFDDVGDVLAEGVADALDGGEGVLDDVVEEAGRHADDVQLHVGEDVGDLERMDQIRLARMAHLSLVLQGRKHVGPPEQLEVGVGAVAPDLVEQVLEANHGNWCLTYRAGFAAPEPGVPAG